MVAGDKEDVDRAVAAARFAFEEGTINSAVVVRSILFLKQARVMAGPGEWSELSSKQRGDLLYRLAELIDQEKEALALLGTSLSLSLYTCAAHVIRSAA